MADFGRICVIGALLLAAYLTAASAVGVSSRSALWLASARRAVYGAVALASLAWATLVVAFVRHDFSIEIVADYNSRFNSLAYSISGAYASQPGSLLMWAWGVTMALLVATLQFRGQEKGFMPWATTVMGVVATFFLALVAFVSDPFAKSQVIPADGQGLNPLLENVGMLFHPPALYIGYVAYTVPFAFAIAALITGRLEGEWLRQTRRWALVAWAFLTIGNILGAQWAYVELGWGGYWGWDPVENSSFMPWLTGTAFLHSVMVQNRRGMFKVWTLCLAISTFLLTIFGTFLTRSDILSSVHTFGDTGLGPLFVAFMALVAVVSGALIFDRWPLLGSDAETESFASREAGFLLNNLLFVLCTVAVFWGTMFPVISEVTGGAKITVNASFFNQVAGPILLAIVVLMGLCPLLAWRSGSTALLVRSLPFSLGAGLVAVAASIALGAREIWT
ncbi:MAG: cytochrome c biogenesis protein CcsA, partial [Chloroflexi bacterium]|nr:cytochrome c biogenesis protein CcsA [Chloroflexota bacterium]